MLEQSLHTGADFVADFAHFFHGLALGIAEGPVVAAEAGDVRALVAATHGDEELRLSR